MKGKRWQLRGRKAVTSAGRPLSRTARWSLRTASSPSITREKAVRTSRVVLALTLLALLGCETVQAESRSPPGPVPKIRDVRVLLGAAVDRVRLRADGPVTLSDGRTLRPADGLAEDGVIAWHTTCGSGADARGGVAVTKAFGDAGSRTTRESCGDELSPTPRVTLRPAEGDAIRLSLDRAGQWSAEVAYPGLIHLTAGDAGGLEVVNELDLERYVGCVVANEVWPTFDAEAFRAQAIVSRSFVLYQMSRRPNAPFDVSATQGSQVYRGIRDDAVGRRAVEAAEYTRGIVCTWRDRDEDRLFCTYYSAACGGVSQSAALLGPEGDVPPLRGGVKCDYCKIAPADAYRWGPVRLPVAEVLAHLIERYPDLASLGGISAITPLEQTPSGRLITLRITGQNGANHDMLAERFRLAIGPTVIRSTDCRIRVKDGEMIFENGKGYGHGLGLCQWGMQGLAQSGKHAAEILRFYYPDAKLTRAY